MFKFSLDARDWLRILYVATGWIFVITQPSRPVVPLELLPLRTESRWVVDSHGDRFRLKCVNWYGADSELFVVGGLHSQNISSITDSIVGLGCNCVRLPFSLALYFEDPRVPAHAMARAVEDGELSNESSGLEVLDASVNALTDAGLLVFLDNHNSEPGWCCDPSQEDGLWFTDRYPEDRWIEALVGIVQRYHTNRRVVGVELRNEVRDNPSQQVTWGDGLEADWRAAAERAGNAVLRQNPDVLVVVTGLCYGSDLRGARDHPVRLERPGRLLWASHSYHWYFSLSHKNSGRISQDIVENEVTWQDLGSFLACAAALQLFVAALLCRCCGARASPLDLAVVALVLLVVAGALLLAVANSVAHSGVITGCSDWGRRNAEQLRAIGRGFIVAGLVVAALLCARRVCSARAAPGCGFHCSRTLVAEDPLGNKDAQLPAGEVTAPVAGRSTSFRRRVCSLGFALLLMLAAATGTGAFFAGTATSDWRLHAELEKMWGFALEEGQPFTAPVWISEFGTSRSTPFWTGLASYVAMQDLDFAYWPLNGEKWRHGSWQEESYGLLERDWTSVRRPLRMHQFGFAADHH